MAVVSELGSSAITRKIGTNNETKNKSKNK
jgi:hypothetical protein